MRGKRRRGRRWVGRRPRWRRGEERQKMDDRLFKKLNFR